jgi:hypothetical protein
MEYTQIQGIKVKCEHEIGKPGAWHLCRRPAVKTVLRGVITLSYCARHAHLAKAVRP